MHNAVLTVNEFLFIKKGMPFLLSPYQFTFNKLTLTQDDGIFLVQLL